MLATMGRESMARVRLGFLAAAVALVVWAVYTIRARRQAAGLKPIVDQATLDRVLEQLKKLADQPKQSTSGT